jgi:NodT family efflux transporter outer membrane factor (OMF) lipoprotein
MLVSMSGCFIPKLRGAVPGPALPPDYNGAASAENSADVSIDEFFSDPTLTQLIVYGLAQNQELKTRNEDVQIASNTVLARRGAYLPFLSLDARGGLERNSRFTPLGAAEDQLTFPGGGRFPDPLPNVGLGANFLWQIDYLRQYRNARDAAIQRYYEALDNRDYFVTTLVADISDNYFELASFDQRLLILNQIIELQQKSLEVARAQKEAARGTELGVQRFTAEVRKNESQRLIIRQRIIEVENRINFLAGRFPQYVARQAWDFINLDSRVLSVGAPAQLLLNRRDIRAAEREVAASGLDVLVARANFFPKLALTGSVGYEAFNPRYLFDPGAFIASAGGQLVAPLVNRKAIRADYLTANARQLQAIYNYQRTVINAFTEVVNRLAKVENYRESVAIKAEQVGALEQAVEVATGLFMAGRPEVAYADVLFVSRDLLDARTVLIETKQQQLSAIVNAYQALGGGLLLANGVQSTDGIYEMPAPQPLPGEFVPPPLPPAPEVLPAPEGASAPQAPPGTEAAPNVAGASSGEEAVGRAAVTGERKSRTLVSRARSDLDPDELSSASVDQQPGTGSEIPRIPEAVGTRTDFRQLPDPGRPAEDEAADSESMLQE